MPHVHYVLYICNTLILWIYKQITLQVALLFFNLRCAPRWDGDAIKDTHSCGDTTGSRQRYTATNLAECSWFRCYSLLFLDNSPEASSNNSPAVARKEATPSSNSNRPNTASVRTHPSQSKPRQGTWDMVILLNACSFRMSVYINWLIEHWK